jgi:hypothetical protein
MVVKTFPGITDYLNIQMVNFHYNREGEKVKAQRKDDRTEREAKAVSTGMKPM